MPTQLGKTFPPNYILYPPGMSMQDYQLWTVWKQTGLKGAERVYFNVRLGSGCDPGAEVTDEERKWWLDETSKRADVIAEWPDKIEIIELRWLCNANAVGRLLCYKMCYLEDPVCGKPLHLRIVTNKYDRDVDMLTKLYEIAYTVI